MIHGRENWKIRAKTVDFWLRLIYNIKAVCRDGGAVERARFEIVLCRNVYKGSNPFLCATKKRTLCGCVFSWGGERLAGNLEVTRVHARSEWRYAYIHRKIVVSCCREEIDASEEIKYNRNTSSSYIKTSQPKKRAEAKLTVLLFGGLVSPMCKRETKRLFQWMIGGIW